MSFVESIFRACQAFWSDGEEIQWNSMHLLGLYVSFFSILVSVYGTVKGSTSTFSETWSNYLLNFSRSLRIPPQRIAGSGYKVVTFVCIIY